MPTDYPLSAQEERDRRLSRLPMADFPPPPTVTAHQRLKIKKSATVVRPPEFSQMTLPPPPTPVETVTKKNNNKPPPLPLKENHPGTMLDSLPTDIGLRRIIYDMFNV